MADSTTLGDLITSNHLREGVTLDCLTPLENGDVEMVTTLEDGEQTMYTIPAADVTMIYRLAMPDNE